ncbi:SDR family oxidoreductase [Undibacterium sp. TJN25]|uniref:SDR family oxidoreductase n=1 Tax=Undibacterium sp. TJN25 TaxID=3413056 RepID=UPI003BF06D3E
MKIKDSIAFVTGANRGLGLAIAEELLRRGARKVYAGVRTPSGAAIPGIVEVKLDVTDPASVAAAAAACADTTILVNNAGIAAITGSTLDAELIAVTRSIAETNFYGLISMSQAFFPALSKAQGQGAIVNVLSDASWFSRPMLAAYSLTKSAAWSFTNALRIELREKGVHVLALHMGFMDTDMTKGFDMQKVSPQEVAAQTLDGLEAGTDEVLADASTRAIRQSLSSKEPAYLFPPEIV